jgi:hypothetical protein
MYDLEDIQEEKQEFVIDTDAKADWALKIIQKERQEVERLTKTIDEEIEMLKLKKQRITDSLDNKIGFLQSKLFEYFKVITPKESKTCYKYKLPSGELVYNKETVKYERDDEKIIQWLTDHNHMDYIKIKPSVDWAELKKTDFVDEIDGITKLNVPMTFTVK